jgi:hypothetical protein
MIPHPVGLRPTTLPLRGRDKVEQHASALDYSSGSVVNRSG